jgi:hypothetical protein
MCFALCSYEFLYLYVFLCTLDHDIIRKVNNLKINSHPYIVFPETSVVFAPPPTQTANVFQKIATISYTYIRYLERT